MHVSTVDCRRPIVVYSNIRDALKERTISIHAFDNGLKTFIIGLGYKVIIANRIGTLWNEVCTIGFESISTPLAWLGAFAYSMQLYFDFCGYSLMAVGLGEMLGFYMPANFQHPIWLGVSLISGADGISRSAPGFGNTCTFRLAATAKAPRGRCSTSWWYGFSQASGTARHGTLFSGGFLSFVLQIIEKNITLRWLNADHLIAKLLSHTTWFFIF